MSIEIPVTEDIREYEPKDIGPFTFKQALAVALVIIIEAIIIKLLYKPLGQAIIIPIVITAFPIIAQGFWKPLGGFSFKDYINIKFNNSNQLNTRSYRNNNNFKQIEDLCNMYVASKSKKNKKRKRYHA